ncbi:hypothetical protein NCC49_006018 [Naganishia albida]|nr:hypothetical protein NCC49_006018 [Naganishia albida]
MTPSTSGPQGSQRNASPSGSRALKSAQQEVDMNQDVKDGLRQWLRFIWKETRNLPSSVAVERLVRTIQQLDTSSILGCPLSQQWTTKAACLELVKYIKDELVATEEILALLIIALDSRQGCRGYAARDRDTSEWIVECKLRKPYTTERQRSAAVKAIRMGWGKGWHEEFGWEERVEERGVTFLKSVRALMNVGKAYGWGIEKCAKSAKDWAGCRGFWLDGTLRKEFAEGITHDDVTTTKQYIEQRAGRKAGGLDDEWVMAQRDMFEEKMNRYRQRQAASAPSTTPDTPPRRPASPFSPRDPQLAPVTSPDTPESLFTLAAQVTVHGGPGGSSSSPNINNTQRDADQEPHQASPSPSDGTVVGEGSTADGEEESGVNQRGRRDRSARPDEHGNEADQVGAGTTPGTSDPDASSLCAKDLVVERPSDAMDMDVEPADKHERQAVDLDASPSKESLQ